VSGIDAQWDDDLASVRNIVIVSDIDAQWDDDLASMENVSKYNNGIRFLLVLIDIFVCKIT